MSKKERVFDLFGDYKELEPPTLEEEVRDRVNALNQMKSEVAWLQKEIKRLSSKFEKLLEKVVKENDDSRRL